MSRKKTSRGLLKWLLWSEDLQKHQARNEERKQSPHHCLSCVYLLRRISVLSIISCHLDVHSLPPFVVRKMRQERKRNAQRKVKEADAELFRLTNVGVRSSYSISNSVGASDVDRRVSGTMDPPDASVYAPAPVSHVATAPPPPSYYEYVTGGVAQPHFQ